MTKTMNKDIDSLLTDTISVAVSVGEVVAQMGAVYRHGLSVGQHTDILPIRFLVSKRWPPMSFALDEEVVHRSPDGSRKEDLAGI